MFSMCNLHFLYAVIFVRLYCVFSMYSCYDNGKYPSGVETITVSTHALFKQIHNMQHAC